MKATGTRPKITVTADGRAVVGHAGARLLADLAEASGLARTFGDVLAELRQRAGGHDPGRIAVDVAVMLADGGEAISDLAVLRDQATLLGPVASDSTAWRLLFNLEGGMLDRLGRGPRPSAGNRVGATPGHVWEPAGHDGSRPTGAGSGPGHGHGHGHGRLDRHLPLRKLSRFLRQDLLKPAALT